MKKIKSVNAKYTPVEASARCIWSRKYNKELLFEDFYRLSQMNCYYCNAAPNNIQNAASSKKSSQFLIKNGYFIYNGLDRVDNNLPHILENVVPCCKYCNWAKRERTVEEFLEWIAKVWQNIGKNFIN